MKRLTEAEFEAACEEHFPLALEAEARRARGSEAALLEALNLARLWTEAMGFNGKDAGMKPPDWLALARDAIAKAEGKP